MKAEEQVGGTVEKKTSGWHRWTAETSQCRSYSRYCCRVTIITPRYATSLGAAFDSFLTVTSVLRNLLADSDTASMHIISIDPVPVCPRVELIIPWLAILAALNNASNQLSNQTSDH